MSSWRDADDPRCPECGGPLSPMSVYCMHCGTDLDAPGDSDVSDSDDYDPGATVEPMDAIGFLRNVWSTSSSSDTQSTEYDRDSYLPPRHPASADEPPATPKAPLWMRAPIAVVVGLFVSVLSMLVLLAVVEQISGTFGFFYFVGSWLGISVYLGKKPVPSDIVGDAFYTIAVLILLGPLLGYTNAIGTALLYGTDDPASLFGDFLIVEFFVLFPAGVFAALGYVGNWWAAKQLARATARRR